MRDHFPKYELKHVKPSHIGHRLLRDTEVVAGVTVGG
jgi:hypothetical protein